MFYSIVWDLLVGIVMRYAKGKEKRRFGGMLMSREYANINADTALGFSGNGKRKGKKNKEENACEDITRKTRKRMLPPMLVQKWTEKLRIQKSQPGISTRNSLMMLCVSSTAAITTPSCFLINAIKNFFFRVYSLKD